MNFAENAAFDHFLGLRNATAVPPLRSYHHNAVILAGGLDHPFAFVDTHGHGLLDVDILARRASHDGEQRVPMVRRGHHDSLDVLVLEHLPEIAVAFRIGIPHELQSLAKAGLIDVAQAHQIDLIGKLLEIRDVLLADQAKSDKTDADAVVGAQHPLVRCRCQRGRSHERPSCGGKTTRFLCHLSFSFRGLRSQQ